MASPNTNSFVCSTPSSGRWYHDLLAQMPVVPAPRKPERASPTAHPAGDGDWIAGGLLANLLVVAAVALVGEFALLRFVLVEHIALAVTGAVLVLLRLGRPGFLLLAVGGVPLIPVGLLCLLSLAWANGGTMTAELVWGIFAR